jgi:Putative peptidoglycan binding domain/HdeA/HdeB family
MKRLIVAAVALAAPFAASSAQAGTRDGRFAVEGAGRVDCANYLKARNAKLPAYPMMISFMEGYLTAANRYEAATFDLTPWHTTAAISVVVDDYCKRHPNDLLAVAAQKLTIAFKPQRLEHFSDLVEVRNGKAATLVYKSLLERTQTALSEKGFYRGKASGAYSPELMAALLDFQKSAQLKPTGIPDSATVWKLLAP